MASRADLVRVLGMLPSAQHTYAASAVGFIPHEEPAPELKIAVKDNVIDAQNGAEGRLLERDESTPQPSDLRVPLLRFDRMEFSDEPQTEKPRTTIWETVTQDDLRSPGRSLLATPRQPSLTPWSRLWPLLRDALHSSLPSRDLDVDAYVRGISRGVTIREIPRKIRRVWADRCSVWIDRSPRLVPFFSDQLEVWNGLRKLCNKSGLTRRLLDGRIQMRSFRQRGDLLDKSSNTTDVPILVLGDLGLYGADTDREAWERTGKRLQAHGSRLTALVPSPNSRLLPFMRRTWNARAWERGSTGGKPEEGWAARRDRLLKMVSPVGLLQPGLMRAIRRLLPAGLADASTEADVWNHAEVQVADATGWLLEPAALLKWREAFAADSSLDSYRAELSKTIRVWHENLPREILRGETLVWHALVPDVAPPGELEDAVGFAKRLEATALAGGPEARLDPLRSFQKKLLATMPATIYERVPALATVWVASFGEGEVPPGVDAQAIRGRLEEAGELRHWAIRQVGTDLVFSLNGRRTEWPSYVEGPGSPVAWLEATRPWVYIERAGRVVQKRLENGLSLEWDANEPVVLRTDRCTVRLSPWHIQDEPGWSAAGCDRFGLWADAKIHGVVQRFRWIPPGRFLMGSPDNEEGRSDTEGPQHWVTWTEGRWLGDTPVTQALWKAATGKNPSRFQSGTSSAEQRPVEQVRWNECVEFANEIGSRLPMEAEWEYACRAGTITATWVGSLDILGDHHAPRLDAIAWYGGNCGVGFDLEHKGSDARNWPDKQYSFDRGGARGVRLKKPNPFGLYDMLGNVYEWCRDVHARYGHDTTTVPEGANRVIRGGSWSSPAKFLRAAHRHANHPGDRYGHVGFRLARDARSEKSKKGSG